MRTRAGADTQHTRARVAPQEQLSCRALPVNTVLRGNGMTVGVDVEQLRETEPYEILANPVLGQEYRLLERGSDSDGEFLRFELRYRAGATHFPQHVHPRHDEPAAWLGERLRDRSDPFGTEFERDGEALVVPLAR